MSSEVLIYLAVGALAGGFINGLAGFGTALLALGFWLQVLDPATAVTISVTMSVFSGVQGIWVVRDEIRAHFQRLLGFLLPALPGVPIGAMVLSMIPATALKLVIAAMMMLYGAFFTFRRSLPAITGLYRVTEAGVGFAGGVLGGAAGLSGALPTMWCAMRPWSKGETRAVLQAYNVCVLALACLTLAFYGLYTRETLLLIAVAVPISLLGAQIGISIYHKLSDSSFRRLLVVLLFAAGLLLSLREIFTLL